MLLLPMISLCLIFFIKLNLLFLFRDFFTFEICRNIQSINNEKDKEDMREEKLFQQMNPLYKLEPKNL